MNIYNHQYSAKLKMAIRVYPNGLLLLAFIKIFF